MGAAHHSYALGLALLAIVAAGMAAFSMTVIRKAPHTVTDHTSD